MLFRPGLAIGAFILPDYDDGYVRLPSDGGRGANRLNLRLGIGLRDFVLVPRRPALLSSRDFAALGVEHLDAFAGTLSNAFENADLVSRTRVATVAAQMNIGCIGPDDRDG